MVVGAGLLFPLSIAYGLVKRDVVGMKLERLYPRSLPPAFEGKSVIFGAGR